MNHRAFALALATLASLTLQGAVAQGLRPSGTPLSGKSGLSSPSAPLARPAATPSITLPAPGASTAPRSADFIVAVVNSEPVTNYEVRSRLARAEAQLAKQGGAMPPRDLLAREVLERIILEKVQLQQARDAGIKVDDFAVSQAEQGVARQNDMTVDQLYARLGRDGMGKERFREELRNQLLQQRLREREVEARVKVSDLDVDQFLREEQKGTDVASMEINLGHVLVLVPENASPAQVAERQARAQRAADKVRGGEDFAAVARELSQDGSSREGGDLGWASPGRYVPEFEQALDTLKPGDISEPLVSRFGVHLIQLLERREAKLTQREQREMARSAVREKKLDEAYATWAQELRGRAYVEYRDPPQ